MIKCILLALICACAPLKQAIKLDLDPSIRMGIQVASTKTGQILYEHRANELFVPASSLKVLTAASALYYLGPSYRYETPVLADAISTHTIQNLYIKGSGDPSLDASDLDKIARMLKQYGIQTIKGNIVVDNTAFDDILYGSGWMWDEMHKGFSAPTDALNLNYNRVVVVAKPGSKADDPLRVTTEPHTRYIKTNLKPSKSTFQIKSTSEPGNALQLHDEVDVTGKIPQGSRYQYHSFAVKDPSLFAGHILLERLREQGIHIKGYVTKGPVPADAEILDTITSKTLGEALINFMKFSNNEAMEAILKTIGLKTSGAPASFDAGIKATEQFLYDQVGLKNSHLTYADASGLSRYTQISPSDFVKVLLYMWPNFNMGPDFVASLPLDGHMRYKTGTMTGICSSVGYLQTDSGDVLAFAVMLNGREMERATCQKQIKDILTAVTQSTN